MLVTRARLPVGAGVYVAAPMRFVGEGEELWSPAHQRLQKTTQRN